MKRYRTLEEIHEEFMKDPEYKKAYEEEVEAEQLRDMLSSWRKEAGLTSAQVAERMGVKPPTVSRMERNATKMTYDTLRRYADACGIRFEIVSVS